MSSRRATSCTSGSTCEPGSGAVRSPRGALGAPRAELTARLPLARLRARGARFRLLVPVGARAAGAARDLGRDYHPGVRCGQARDIDRRTVARRAAGAVGALAAPEGEP